MTDEKDKPTAHAPAATTQPAKKILTPAEAELDRLKNGDGRILSDDPELARRAAQAEIESIARRAIDWKKTRGVYPWEEPQTEEDKKIAKEQAAWAKQVGIDPEKSADEFLGRVKEAIHRLEGQKKTEPRGR